MAKPDATAQQETTQEPALPSAEQAAKRVKGQVTVPKLDKKGDRVFSVPAGSTSRVYANETVPVAAEHILAVKAWGVVTIDGQKLLWS